MNLRNTEADCSPFDVFDESDTRFKRVIYSQNPLIEVVCQLRFPLNLRIQSQPPMEFQAAIQKQYPYLEIEKGIEVNLTPQLGHAEHVQKTQSYKFSSEDREWVATLSPAFFGLSTTNYKRWEEYLERFGFLATQFFNSYEIPLISRVGLRYRDLIDRSALGLDQNDWSELLNANVSGMIGGNFSEEKTFESFNTNCHIELEGLDINFQCGLARNTETKTTAFLLDSDYYIKDKTGASANEASDSLERCHKYAGRLFRWCISERLHNALDPTPAD